MSKFNIGDKVVLGTYQDNKTVAEVKGHYGNDYVILEWENATAPGLYLASELSSVSEFEEAFKSAVAELEDEINKSATHLRRAAYLKDKFHIDDNEMYDEIHPLLKAIDEFGWSSSSLMC